MSNSCIFAQNNYSPTAISIYNSGAMLQKQHKYELAEQKYNQVLKLQPNFVEAKNNLAIIYYDRACDCHSKNDYNNAIVKANKSIFYNPKNIGAYEVLAKSYEGLNDYQKAITVFDKIIVLSPSDDNALHSTAELYIKSKRYDKASELYRKLLQINPNDKAAAQNLKYAEFQISEKSVSQLIDSVNKNLAEHTAPKALYDLIQPSYGINSDSVEKMKTILDLIWSDSNGRILLQALVKKRIPINLTQGAMNANATSCRKNNTFMLYGFVPILTFSTFSGKVNISVNYISDFYNRNLTSYQRIYSLHVFLHEFGHAFMSIKNPNNTNSLEEELGVSMIGYNIATKIITGKYLDEKQTKTYSEATFISLLSDDHRNLPVYSGFDNIIQQYGIILPHPYIYSDLRQMYEKLFKAGKVKPCPSFTSILY